MQERERERATPGVLAAAEAERDRVAVVACERCGGAGMVRVTDVPGEPMFGVPVFCSCVPVEERMRRAGVPERFVGATLDNFDELDGKSEALQWARRWGERHPVVFCGSRWGTGKTHLACALLRQSVESCHPSQFWSVPALLEATRSRFDDGATEQAQEFMARVAAVPVLVLDDLGAERGTDWTREQLRLLIDRRWSNDLTTIVTTNLGSPKALGDVLGGAVASRLAGWPWLLVGGVDMRQREAVARG
ncbi:MAG: ATP-binding protein [Proteobacteria bacterium]|nr:ATP-binding protein [Pseudomonadota bacterium]